MQAISEQGMMQRNLRAAAAAGSGITSDEMKGGTFNKAAASQGPSVNRVGVSLADKAIQLVREKREREEEEARKKAEALAAAAAAVAKIGQRTNERTTARAKFREPSTMKLH